MRALLALKEAQRPKLVAGVPDPSLCRPESVRPRPGPVRVPWGSSSRVFFSPSPDGPSLSRITNTRRTGLSESGSNPSSASVYLYARPPGVGLTDTPSAPDPGPLRVEVEQRPDAHEEPPVHHRRDRVRRQTIDEVVEGGAEESVQAPQEPVPVEKAVEEPLRVQDGVRVDVPKDYDVSTSLPCPDGSPGP